ncbi:hypothetical protein FKR81_06265 [Lentzea tibetensis]|uniref:Lipoprotein LpqN n=1 Tax=Lentzea tibetensis TaxID=2591470 RepID=A0A563F1C7_9PSEU|nr:hypothetical protein [Lentzea tibetensis]TWP53551.1 hypothetical protein FKR81_06265 [Lentzea tibetensis]
MFRVLLAAAVLVGLVSACGQPAKPTADHVAIPGTKVSLRPPEGMQVDAKLPGLRRPDTQSTVTVTVMPESAQTAQQRLDAMAEVLTSEKVNQQSIKMAPFQRVTVAGMSAITSTGTHEFKGKTFARAAVVMAGDDGAVMMTAELDEDDPLSAEDALAVLTDAKWN